MPPSGTKISQKWGFGMAPFLPDTERRYCTVVRRMKEFLSSRTPADISMEPEVISEVKGLVNRCIRQDQWDWFTVYSRLGAPSPTHLRVVSALLPELRSAILSQNAEAILRLHEQLSWTTLLSCCLNFLGEANRLRGVPKDGGYVYVLSTREHPDLLKIGFTTRSVEERVKEINAATGVLFPLSARRVFLVRSAQNTEQRVFSALAKHRIRSDREFFQIDFYAAIRQIEDCIDSEQLLHRTTGTMLWYSEVKGYGFAAVNGDAEQKVLVHRSEVRREQRVALAAGMAVEFEACESAKGLFAIQLCITPA